MSLMISMTWYDAPHIVVGDHLQFGPHSIVEHRVHNALQSENPFAPSITNRATTPRIPKVLARSASAKVVA